MKRFALLALFGFTIAALPLLSTPALAQAAPTITGLWTIQQTGVNGTTAGKVKITQSGLGFVGAGATSGNNFSGTFVNDTQINGKWHGPGGAGWLTVYVSPNGNSLNGTWGYNGRPSNGTFVGNKVLPPSAVTAAGKWHVAVAGGPGGFAGPMVCTQSGISAICRVAQIAISGKFRTKDKVRATWTSGSRNGWFSFWFNDDNNSFNGEWGYGKDTTPAVGRVIGQRALS